MKDGKREVAEETKAFIWQLGLPEGVRSYLIDAATNPTRAVLGVGNLLKMAEEPQRLWTLPDINIRLHKVILDALNKFLKKNPAYKKAL